MSGNLKRLDISELKPRITIFGVGGAGGNAVNNMIDAGLQGVDFVVANTDAQALAMTRAEREPSAGLLELTAIAHRSGSHAGAAPIPHRVDSMRGPNVRIGLAESGPCGPRIARKDFIHASEVRPQLPPSGSHRKAHGRTRYGLPGPRPHSLGFGSSSSAISGGANAGAPGVDKGGNIFNLTLLGQYGAAAFFQR